MSRALAVLVGVTSLVLAAWPARAAPSAPLPPRFAYLDVPPPSLTELPPEPTREGDEYPRRAWEGFPSGGGGVPFCRGSAFGVGHCGDATTGATVGAGLLYRVSPYVAIGIDASFARFTSRSTTTGTAPYSHASWIGLLVRGYFLDRGMLDPYVETGSDKLRQRPGTSMGRRTCAPSPPRRPSWQALASTSGSVLTYASVPR